MSHFKLTGRKLKRAGNLTLPVLLLRMRWSLERLRKSPLGSKNKVYSRMRVT